MKNFFLFTNLFFLCLVIFLVTTISAQAKDVGGILFQDTTWALADSPIIVISNVSVIEGITLTIEAGVTVKFNAGIDLLVDGTLVARGTADSPIIFTSNAGDTPGKWGAISFSDSSTDATFDGSGNYTGGCILQYVTVQYGGEGFNAGIKIATASPYIDHTTITQNKEHGINVTKGSPVFSHNEIKENYSRGINYTGGSGSVVTLKACTIRNNRISNGRGAGIYVDNGVVNLTDCTLSDNIADGTSSPYGGGIYADSSTVNATNCTFSKNRSAGGSSGWNRYSGYGGAIYNQDSSITNATNCTFSNNSATGAGSGSGGAIYSGTVNVINCTFSGNSTSAHEGSAYGGAINSSVMTISGCTFTGNSAEKGGAICGKVITLKSSTFTGNTGTLPYGAAIWLSFGSNDKNCVIGGSLEDANTIGDNNGDGIYIYGHPTFSYNNLTPNTGLGLICGNGSSSEPIDARYNYWGSEIEGVVKAMIWDNLDDPAKGLVNYSPFLTSPVEPDAESPGAVIDLAVGSATESTLTLTWTATGDNGAVGTASQYDIRYSTSEITDDNWDSATQVDGEPAPKEAGTAESFTVTGLSPDTTYHFAMKTADEVPNWSELSNVPSATTTSMQTNCVWPGDTNNDGKVDQADVLPLGLHWVRTGPARQGASFMWECQSAEAWNPEAATYADASGDGTVNQADVLPLGVNWGLTHEVGSLAPVFSPESSDGVQYSIKPIVIQNLVRNQFTVGVKVQQASNLFGIAFALKYTPNAIKPLSIEAGDLLGSDVIFYPNVDGSEGTVRIGISRKRPQSGVNGSGIVAKITFQSNFNLPAVRMIIQETVAVNSGGKIISLRDAQNTPNNGEWLMPLPQMPGVSQLFQNFPNPFNPETWIPFQLKDDADVTIKIYDTSGKVIRGMNVGEKPAGFYTSKENAAYWDGRNINSEVVASGVYFYAIRAGKFFATKKMIVVR